MKLKEIIERINFEDTEMYSSVDFEKLANEFEIYDLYWSEDTRLKAYFVKVWLCTDRLVGTRAYFLDDEFIAISEQNARKSNEYFSYVSHESSLKLKSYLESLRVKDDLMINLLNLDEELNESYAIEYNTQIVHKTAILNNEEVKIANIYKTDQTNWFLRSVDVELNDGTIKEVDCRDLLFKYNTLD